jgi:ribonuclease P protein component
MGLIVPRFQSTAVARNRLRRRLQEIWRRDVRSRQGGRDLLLRARKEAYLVPFAHLRTELLAWVGTL